MAFINEYPYSDFNEYNMDWIIKTVKDLSVAWAETKTEWGDMQTEWTNYKNYIDNYFAQLDLQEEVNTKIDQMTEQGYFSDLFNTLFRSDVITEAGSVTSAWIDANLSQEVGYVIDDSLTVSNAAADAKVTGDHIFAAEADISYLIDNVYYKSDDFYWPDMGNASYPQGWMQGYYKTTDGTRVTTASAKARWISSRIGVWGRDDIMTLVPPTGFGCSIYEYGDGTMPSFITKYGDNVPDVPVTIQVTAGHFYRFNVGPFELDDAADYFEDADFLATIHLYTLSTIRNDIIRNGNVSIFDKVGVCGASWDSGYYYDNTDTSHEINRLSWCADLARKYGVDYGIYAKHSLYTKTWLSSSDGLTKLLNDTPCGLYITTFGANDSEQGAGYLGSIADLSGGDYTQYPDTFYGNYGKIIEQIHIYAPDALQVMIMYFNPDIHSATRESYYNAVLEIASHYGLPVMNWNNDAWFRSDDLMNNLVHNHPTLIQLSGIAESFARLFDKSIKADYSYYKDYNPTA